MAIKDALSNLFENGLVLLTSGRLKRYHTMDEMPYYNDKAR